MSGHDIYQTPLNSRYASEEMKKLFSARNRIKTWRHLWLWLAESEKELGIDQITDAALEQLRAHLEPTDESFEVARVEEKIRRHDVMAHVHALGKEAPEAAGIIHYGATSCYVTDNAELILMRDALDIIIPKLAKVINNFQNFAEEYKNLPVLGYTHFQAAQPITLGWRASTWIHALLMDLEDLEYVREKLKFRGAQGTTGSQASFMEIFKRDGAKIDRLNELLRQKAGFSATYDVSTQTYTRKVDLRVANAVSGLGSTAQYIATQIRLLAHEKELEEPFEAGQIGSSAMAYKRNPMRSERICSLARELSTKPNNFQQTFQTQWLERTLDDSAIRRIDIPEMFLLADAILISLDNVSNGLVVYEAIIRKHLMDELPFMATENILMRMVALGGDRQEGHEQIRVLSHQAAAVVKQEGKPNDLIERIKAAPYFAPVREDVDAMLRPELFVGRSVELTQRYVAPGGVVDRALAKYADYIVTAGTAQLSL